MRLDGLNQASHWAVEDLQNIKELPGTTVPRESFGMRTASRPVEIQRTPTGSIELLIEDPGHTIHHDVDRPGHRVGGHRQSAGRRLQHDHSECVGAAGKDKYIRCGIVAGQILTETVTGPMDILKSSFKAPPRRPVPDDHHAAGQIQPQKGLKVLFHRHSTDRQKDRSWQAVEVFFAGVKMLGVDSARPHGDRVKTMVGQFSPH